MRQAYKSSLSLLLFLVSVAPACFALFVDDLYLASVPTNSQSDEQRRADAKAGLAQVLIRVSGTESVVNHPLVKTALKSPERYYSEFSYIEEGAKTEAAGEGLSASVSDPRNVAEEPSPVDEKDLVRLTADGLPGRQVMRIRFEPSLVAQLLKRAELPVWGSNRPSVLAWIALSGPDGREVVGEALTQPFAKRLRAIAEARGVPIFLPVWDLEDRRDISVAEIWGRFLDRLEQGSVRYSPDKILVFRAESPFLGEWQGDWSLGGQGQWRGGSVTAESEEALAEALVDALARLLSDQYAVTSFRSEITLTVEGLTDLASYAQVAKYLTGLGQMISVQPRALTDDMVTFTVKSEGDIQQMMDVIALDRALSLLRADPQAGTLWYRWAP